MLKKTFLAIGGAILILLALVGWGVLFVQKPEILARARFRYLEAVKQKIDLNSGPCLGKIADDWVLDIAHLPREPIDNLPENQCSEFRLNKVHHFVEMSPKGEVIKVQ